MGRDARSASTASTAPRRLGRPRVEPTTIFGGRLRSLGDALGRVVNEDGESIARHRFAALLGVSEDHIGALEAGRRSPSGTLRRLVEVYERLVDARPKQVRTFLEALVANGNHHHRS